MQGQEQKKAELLEELWAELEILLRSDDLSEGRKLSRIRVAQQIIENGEV